MSQFNPMRWKAFVASAALAAATPNQFLRVKLSSGQLVLAGAADREIGTLRSNVFNALEETSVDLRTGQGTAQFVASGAITALADVFTDASGKVTATYATGADRVGIALEAASANNDVIEVLRTAGAASGIVPASVSFAPAAGSANVSLVTLQVKDSNGNAIAGVFNLDVWLSDAASGVAPSATTTSGAVTAGANGVVLGTYTVKQSLRVQTDATGKFILSITDTAKTLFYIASTIPGSGLIAVSAHLVVGNYG